MVRFGKERKKNVPFFLKERKRTERTERSFVKNGKERKERSVLLKRTEKNGKNVPFFRKERKRTERTERSFEKNGCPTLVFSLYGVFVVTVYKVEYNTCLL